MNKTERKNKTNLHVMWPEHGKVFSTKDLEVLNPSFVPITLRVRLDNAIKKDKAVTLIGHLNVGKGRPLMMLTMNPVTQKVLDEAYANKIQPPENGKPSVTPADKTAAISTSEVPMEAIPVDSEPAEHTSMPA